MLWIDIKNNDFIIEKKYTFDLIFSTLGINYKFYSDESLVNEDDILIYYSPILEKTLNNKFIWIKESENLFSNSYLKSEPKYNVRLYDLKNEIKSINSVVSIFSNESELIDENNNGIYLYMDIISDIFFMVTRYEEIICKEKDSHERFLMENSLAYKFKFIDRPIVNEQIEVFFSLLNTLDKSIFKKNKWKDKDFVFFLSHDIDSIFKYRDKFITQMGVNILRKKDIKDSLKCVENYFKSVFDKSIDPFWKFDYLLDIERKYGISASYYFMAGGETSNDNYYSIQNKALKDVFKRIKDNSSEIGLHGSYNSYNNLNLLKNEKNKMGKYSECNGVRQHYLRFQVPDTWNIQQKCNLKYDSTLGYAKYAGFRAGICTPYKPFDILNRKIIDIIEIPLIVMDGTISEAQYMGLSNDEAIKYVKKLINRIIDVNGVFSLLWHNSSLDYNSVWKEWINVYEEIVSYCFDKNALAISGEKILKLYEQSILS